MRENLGKIWTKMYFVGTQGTHGSTTRYEDHMAYVHSIGYAQLRKYSNDHADASVLGR